MEKIIELSSLKPCNILNEPILFDELETPDIPAHLLPSIFAQFAESLALSTETSESLSVMTILGVISTTVAKKFVISPKEGWHEPINIYTLIALPPANNKSLILNCCTKPLIEWEQQQAKLLEPEIKRQQSQRKSEEKMIESLRLKLTKLKEHSAQQQMIEDIANKEASLRDVIHKPVLFVNDTTPESLATLVQEQQGRVAIFSDEGGILETLSGLYSHGVANMDILLKGVDGGEVRIRRKDRSISIKPYLTIVLAIQPAVLKTIGEKRAYCGNGALERFLYVLPKSHLGYRTHNSPPISPSLQNDYHQKVTELLTKFDSLKEECMPTVLKLHELALQQWKNFQAEMEIALRPNGKLAHCPGWGGKISGFALRIAGLLHIAETLGAIHTIQATTMNNAIEISTCLVEHAIAAFGLMGVDEAREDAKYIFQWIKAQGEPTFTQTELTRAMRNKKLGKSLRLNKALQVLQERNIISQPLKLATRKPTIFYTVNPSLLPPTQH